MVFPRRIRAVVFDMDGLLVDTEALIRDIYVELAVSPGVAMPEHVFHRMIGLPTAASDAVARAHFGPDFPLEALHADVNVRVHAPEVGVALKAGVIELLDHLDAARFRAPSPPRPATRRAAHAGAERHPAAFRRGGGGRRLRARQTQSRSVPHRRRAARRGAGDCLALEDSHNGVRAAHAAGMMTVMVPDLLEPTDEMREKCLAIAESLHHVRGDDRGGSARRRRLVKPPPGADMRRDERAPHAGQRPHPRRPRQGDRSEERPRAGGRRPGAGADGRRGQGRLHAGGRRPRTRPTTPASAMRPRRR